jgi:ATP-dependent helicase/nuclease subunit B
VSTLSPPATRREAGRVERDFLGWDEPLLPAVARHLAERHTSSGALDLRALHVVVPGARAGRRLRELLLEAAERRRVRLVPPRVLTTGHLPELLYEADSPAAGDALARRAWVAALRARPADRLATLFAAPPAPADLLGWTRRAAVLQALHAEVSGAALHFRDAAALAGEGLLFDDAERWALLADLQREYERVLARHGHHDPSLERMAALAAGSPSLPGELLLCGVAEMPRVAAAMLRAAAAAGSAPVRALVHAPDSEAGGFDDLGCVLPEFWSRRPVPLADEQVAVCDQPAHQAEEVVRTLAALGSGHAADEVVVAVPDEEIVPYLEQRLASAGAPVHASRGLPLSRSAPVRLLAAFAAYLDGRRYEACAELARHPDLWRWLRRDASDPTTGDWEQREDEWVVALDEYFNERLPSDLRTPARSAGRGTRQGLVAGFCAALEGERVLGPLQGRRRLAEWAPLLLDLLVTVYESLELEHPRERRILEASDRLRAAAAELRALPAGLDETCDAATAIGVLIDAAGEQTLAPESEGAAVELLGWLELHLDDAPVALVTGFNEQFVPESTGAHPFLPHALRTRLGLVDNAARFARDAYQLTALLHSRRTVKVVAGRRTAQGDPLRPSRLLFAVAGDALARRVLRFYGQEEEEEGAPPATAAAGDAPSRFALPPERVIRAPEPIAHLSVSRFARVIGDPYLFALESVLGLRAVDDSARELDGLAFGSLAHDVLERFGRHELCDSSDPAEITALLERLLDERFRQLHGSAPLPAVLLQREQLRVRLRAFASWQANRAAEGWRIVGVECRTPDGGIPFPVDGAPFVISGRIDRIDHHPEHGWALLDYKTGDRGDGPEDTHRRGRAEPREWVDLQLPLYRHLLPHVLDARGVNPAAAADPAAVQLGYLLLPRDPDGVGVVQADWSAEQLEAADERAREVVRFLRRNEFVFEPAAASGAEGALGGLLGALSLLAGEEEEEE